MSHIAELVVRHPNLTLTTTLEEVPDLDMHVESQPVTATNGPTLFYLVQTPDFERFESSLGVDHTVADWNVDAELDDSRIYRIAFTDATRFLTPAFTDCGLRVLDAASEEGGWRVRVHAAKRRQLERFLAYCGDEGVECDLKKVYSTDVDAGSAGELGSEMRLTDRQREVATTAIAMGYFEADGASAAEVADALDISPSTLSTHLRGITAKLFEHHFGS